METKNKYAQGEWDDYYGREKKLHVKIKESGIFTSYDIYLCREILKRHLPFEPERRLLEIGSGDGKLLKDIAALVGGRATGLEYSEVGAKKAEAAGVPTIVADAFDESMIARERDKYDLVFSYGFVEHILPPEKAVAVHLALTKPGGFFVVQIPRLRRFNWLRFKLFRPALLDYHNLPLMEAEALEKACLLPGVEKIFCGAYGTLKLRVPMDQKNFRYYVLKVICLLEYILNPLFRLLFGNRGFETRLFSPALIFIGRKQYGQ